MVYETNEGGVSCIIRRRRGILRSLCLGCWRCRQGDRHERRRGLPTLPPPLADPLDEAVASGWQSSLRCWISPRPIGGLGGGWRGRGGRQTD